MSIFFTIVISIQFYSSLEFRSSSILLAFVVIQVVTELFSPIHIIKLLIYGKCDSIRERILIYYLSMARLRGTKGSGC